MTAADIRNAIGQTDVALADLATAQGKLEAFKILTEGVVNRSALVALDSAMRDIDSARFRWRIVRGRLDHEARLLCAYGTEVAR